MIFLKVPYAEKDEAKALGARWNGARKLWYVPEGQASAPFERWLAPGQTGAEAGQRAGSGRVDSYVGKLVVGQAYVALEHDCNPFVVCDTCRPVLETSGWLAARAELALLIKAIKS